MAHSKLLLKKQKQIKEWTLTPAQIKKLIKNLPAKIGKQKIHEQLQHHEEALLKKWSTSIKAVDLINPSQFLSPTIFEANINVRKNQKDLSPTEWQRFIYSINALADTTSPSPNYNDFLQIHIRAMTTATGMGWGAHRGLNFLTWHRDFLSKFEARLMSINPAVTIPYWNWIENRALPIALSNSSDLTAWGLTRNASPNFNLVATASQLANIMAITDFASFTTSIEQSPFHDRLHGVVGGTMSTAGSPADPIFWLHHAFIDKLFADWEIMHPGINHPNVNQTLQPPPIITRKNSEVWNIAALGYTYS